MKNYVLVRMGTLGLLIASSGLRFIARNMNTPSAYVGMIIILPLTRSPGPAIEPFKGSLLLRVSLFSAC